MSALDQLIADLERLDAKASPGPWFTVGRPWNDAMPYVIARDEDPHRGTFVCDVGEVEEYDEENTFEKQAATKEADAAFIATLRNAYPQLRDGIRALESALAACQTSTRLAMEERDAAREEAAAALERLDDATHALADAQRERAAMAEQLDAAEQEMRELRAIAGEVCDASGRLLARIRRKS